MVTVFGATGHAGRVITKLLLADADTEVTACGRDARKLVQLEASAAGAGARLNPVSLDVGHSGEVEDAIAGADVVVGATSRWQDGPDLAARAIRCGASYLGIYLSQPQKWTLLRRLRTDCLDRGLMIVDDGGAHPGLPGVLIRWIAEESPLRSAWVGARFALRWDRLTPAPETVSDFVAEMQALDPSILRDGSWQRGYRYGRKFDFGYGAETCAPMCLEEIRELGRAGSLPSTGFFIAGFGPVIDYGLFPLSIGLARVSRRAAAGLIWWSLKRFASTREEAILMVEADRASGGPLIRVRVSHPDPYALTAIPAVLAIRQMHAQPRPGVWTQAAFVDPGPFIDGLQRMGVSVERPV